LSAKSISTDLLQEFASECDRCALLSYGQAQLLKTLADTVYTDSVFQTEMILANIAYDVRNQLITAIGGFSPKFESLSCRLLELLLNEDLLTQILVMETLDQLNCRSLDALQLCHEVSRSEFPRVREISALTAAGIFDRNSEESIAYLTQWSLDRDYRMRETSARIFANAKRVSKDCLSLLIRLASDTYSSVRSSIVPALVRHFSIDAEEIFPVLSRLSTDNRWSVRAALAEQLRYIPRPAPKHIVKLASSLARDLLPEIGKIATESMQQLVSDSTSQCMKPLIELARDRQFIHPEILNVLLQTAQNNSHRNRKEALRILNELNKDEDPTVRQKAQIAIVSILNKAKKRKI
jgi:HEAT repeat protein